MGHPPLAVDRVAVDVISGELLQPSQKVGGAGLLFGLRLRVRMHQTQIEAALEEGAGEAALLPVLLARLLSDLSGLELGGEFGLARHRVSR